jgi:cell division protein FtsB
VYFLFMNQLSIGHLVLVLVLGAASAAVTSSLLNTTNAPALVSEAVPDAKLVAQIQALQEENTLLNERVSTLELRPVLTERVAAVDNSAFEEEVRAFMAKNEVKGGATPVALQSKVESALTAIREQEDIDKAEIARQRRDRWISDTIAKSAEELGLTQFQTEEMNRTWIANAEAEAELGRIWQSGSEAERANIGVLKNENRERHQANLQGFLSPDQYDQYTEMVNGWRGRGKGN